MTGVNWLFLLAHWTWNWGRS